MTQSAAREEPIILSADADPLDDLFDPPGDGTGTTSGKTAARPVRQSGGGLNPLLIATLASLVWIAAVAAFCWARYSLPDNPGDAMDVVGSRIGTADWMLIAAAILGPLLLIWVIAWLMRRTGELKRQSQDLANAALRLTHVAQTAEAAGRPLALGAMGEVTGETPRHLRREVERATHAISALHSQMRAIEEALSTQARNIDDVAERAEKRAKYIATTLRTEREALERLSGDDGQLSDSVSIAPASMGAVGTGVGAAGAGLAGIGAAVAAGIDRDEEIEPSSDVTDFALDEARVEAAANSDSAELLTEAPSFARDDHDAAIAEDASDHGDVGVTALRARLADAKANARWERPVLSVEERAAARSRDTESDRSDGIGGDLRHDPVGAQDDVDTGTVIGAGAAAVGAGAAIAAAAPSAVALDREPDDYETLELDTLDDSDDAPFKLERRHAIDWHKFARAANFPESEDDVETLDALYDVLTDPEAASLLQCAEDTLASMADIDLYMEDFIPRLVPVSTWKNHLDGSGGDRIEGIDAPVEQSRIRAKLGADKGFEHLCEKFMDRYEEMGRRLLNETDNEKLIVDLSNTRTGRAYLMIGEAAGRLSA